MHCRKDSVSSLNTTSPPPSLTHTHLQLLLCVNPFPQYWHVYGFSPVCVRICCFRLLLSAKHLVQYMHWYCEFLGRIRRGCRGGGSSIEPGGTCFSSSLNVGGFSAAAAAVRKKIMCYIYYPKIWCCTVLTEIHSYNTEVTQIVQCFQI